jgi:hypothetical protein
MTYFRIGHSEATSTPSQRPFVEYSPHQDRASLMSAVSHKRHKRSRSSRRSTIKKGRRRKGIRVSKVRIVRGQVALRIGGFPGVQKVGASQLVRFVPLNKLRSAAKRVLGAPPKKRGRKSRRVGRRKRQGRRH